MTRAAVLTIRPRSVPVDSKRDLRCGACETLAPRKLKIAVLKAAARNLNCKLGKSIQFAAMAMTLLSSQSVTGARSMHGNRLLRIARRDHTHRELLCDLAKHSLHLFGRCRSLQ
jgi:hypothetical protein